ncbi:NADPH dehydrogenase 3 [Talaromyces pinophilus]|nr:NADPH dehydrogenase 3 [Talaromyces pinophilus]
MAVRKNTRLAISLDTLHSIRQPENLRKSKHRRSEAIAEVGSKLLGQTNTVRGELADSGAGLICFGNIPINRDNLENYNNAVLDINNPWDPVEALAPAFRAAKSRGAICLPQLQFPGRQVPEFLNKTPRSASAEQLGPCLNKTYGKPVPLTKEDIRELIQGYVWAASVLAQAGVDGIILHASHGYIMNQFLSPKTNKRTDEYGGTLENRARFILEVVNAIKAICEENNQSNCGHT